MIKQKPSEPYITFIDHLREVVEKQIDNVAAQKTLFKQLAKYNAKTECKPASAAEESCVGRIEACSKIGTTQYQVEQLTAQVAAAPQISKNWC